VTWLFSERAAAHNKIKELNKFNFLKSNQNHLEIALCEGIYYKKEKRCLRNLYYWDSYPLHTNFTFYFFPQKWVEKRQQTWEEYIFVHNMNPLKSEWCCFLKIFITYRTSIVVVVNYTVILKLLARTRSQVTIFSAMSKLNFPICCRLNPPMSKSIWMPATCVTGSYIAISANIIPVLHSWIKLQKSVSHFPEKTKYFIRIGVYASRT